MGEHGVSTAGLGQNCDHSQPQQGLPRMKETFHLPTTSTTKLSERIGGRGCGLSAVGAGLGPNCAVTTNTLCVLESNARVLAPRCVVTFSATLNLSGDSSFTTVSTPSPQEAKANPVASSNAVASTPSPIAAVARTLPLSPSPTPLPLFSQ